MNRKVLLAGVLVLLLASILSVDCSAAASGQPLSASYSDGTLTIEGQSDACFCGGVVTFDVMGPDGSHLSDAYAVIGDDGSYSCRIDAGDLDSGIYLVEAISSIPGDVPVKSTASFIIGSEDVAVSATYSDNSVLIEGCAPSGYESGVFTCTILSDNGVVAEAYAPVDKDGRFSLKVAVDGIDEGTYHVKGSFDCPGQESFGVLTRFVTESSDFPYGDYNLNVLDIKEDSGKYTVTYESFSRTSGSDYSGAEYELEYESVGDSLRICGFESSAKNVIVLIPASVAIGNRTLPVSFISDANGEGVFSYQKNIVGLVFSSDSTINEVPFNSFRFTSNLEFVEFSDSITIIGTSAFQNSGLTSLMLPKNLYEIRGSAFSGCYKLVVVKAVDGASGLKKIGSSVFYCSSLKEVSIPFKDMEDFHPTAIRSSNIEIIQSTNGYGIYSILDDDSHRNWILKAIDGASKDLVSIPDNHTADIDVPEGVTSISAEVHLTHPKDKDGKEKNGYLLRLPASLEIITGNFLSSTIDTIEFADNSKIGVIPSGVFSDTNVVNVTIPSSVYRLDGAFQNCKFLESVSIQGREVELRSTFSGCFNFKELILVEGACVSLINDTFFNCSFERFDIPEGVVKIDGHVFGNCSYLVELSIPASLEEMSDDALSDCDSLMTIDTAKSTKFKFIGGALLENGDLKAVPGAVESVSLPSSVTRIGTEFQNLKKLTSFTIADGGTGDLEIPNDCFKDCRSLMEVELPSNVKRIGDRAFSGCIRLSEIHIANGSRLASIGAEAFKGTALLDFYMPSTVKDIGQSAFEGCTSLGTVSVPSDSGLVSIGSKAFSDNAIRAFYIPKSVQQIGDSCFKGCNLLSTIVVDSANAHYSTESGALCNDSALLFVPSGLHRLDLSREITSYDVSAFDSASTLEEIRVDSGNSVFSSGNGMLLNKDGTRIKYVPSAMKNILIPSSVTVLGPDAEGSSRSPLRDCGDIESIVYRSSSGTVVLSSFFLSDVSYDSGKVDLFVIDSPGIEINGMSTKHGGIGTLMLICDRLDILGSHTYTSDLNRLVVETKECHISDLSRAGFSARTLCIDRNTLPLNKLIADTGEVYVSESVSGFVPDRGTMAGMYVLDHENWSLRLSSFLLGDKPVFVSNDVDGIDVSSVAIDSDGILLNLRNTGFKGVSWDVDVYVNDILAQNLGDWRYRVTLDIAASYEASVVRHASSVERTVTFHIGGSSDTSEVTVYDGGSLIGKIPDDPRRNGYDFEGWFLDESGTISLDPTDRVTSDLDVYAKWTPRDTVKVEWEDIHGNIRVKAGDKLVESGNLLAKGTEVRLTFEARDGWEFICWEINGASADLEDGVLAVDSDMIISPVLRYTSQSNSLTNIIDVKTPEYGQDVRLLWSRHYEINTDMSVWSGFPSVPAVMDDAVYIRASDTLYKYDASTGEELAKVQSRTIIAYYLYLGIGGGMVVDYATDRVYDENLDYCYSTPKKFVAVFYNDGMFYGLSGGKVFRFDAATGTLDTRGAWGEGVEVTWFGLYGTTSAPVFVGDHMYIVSASTSNDYRGLTEINLSTGKATTMELEEESGRLLDDGWLTHYAYNGKDYLFLTTYSKGLLDTEDAARPASIIGIEVGSDGTLSDQCKILRLDTSSQALSAFVVYNGRGYASGHVMDANKICDAISEGITYIDETQGNAGYQIYKEDAVSSHGSIVLTTAYATEENDYTVYIYMLAYDPSQQAVYIFEDNPNKFAAGKYYKTSPAGSAYGSQAIRATKDGNLVWYTDSGTVYCYGTPANNPYHFELKLDGRTENIDGVGFTALEALKSGLKGAGIPFEITSTGMIVSLDGVKGVWNIEYLYEGKWTNAGLLSAERNDVYRTFRISMEAGSSGEEHDLEVTISEDSKQLYSSGESNRTVTITADIDCDWPVIIEWSNDPNNPGIVRFVGSITERSVTIEALKAGEATITVTVSSGTSYEVVSCKIIVIDPPAKLSEYTFFIKITKDFDKADCRPYSEDDLRRGITISAVAYNAAEALEKACREKGIEFHAEDKTYDNADLKGWIISMFGLKQYQGPEDMSLWTYWAQYKDWNYNQYTLGYYTDGGDFQIIWKTTNEDGSDVPGGGEEITIDTDKDGNTVKTVKDSTEMPDGTLVKTEIKVVTDKDGNLLSKTETKTEERPDGSKTSSVEKTENIKKDDGTEAVEKTGTETVTDKDGNVLNETKTSDTEEKRPDGTVVKTNTENVIEKDSSGKVLNETRMEKTEETGAGGTVTTESFEKKTDGKSTESRNIVSKAADGSSETKVEATVVDGKVEKAESTTVIAPSEGKVGADAAKAAVERSADAISRAGIDAKDVEKTFEVSGASVSVEPGALGAIADHGAGLRFSASEKDSVHLDGDACRSLSGEEGAIDLSMSEGQEKDLLDAQKGAVGDRFFIVLDAVVGDKRIHDLGGKASVSFGYTPAEGENVSKLRVWYVDDEGNRHVVEGSLYDPEMGGFTMELTHFSVYMVAEDSSAPSPEPEPSGDDDEGSGSSSIAIAAIAVVIIAAIVAVAVIRMRKA